MILTDGTHLVSTASLEELHTFAARIGLSLWWFQDHRVPHYDLFGRKPGLAEQAGAKVVTRRDLVIHWRQGFLAQRCPACGTAWYRLNTTERLNHLGPNCRRIQRDRRYGLVRT
ncbi:MAG: hypothetical protein A2Y74_05675 [Actinobacteria bacterium RBG_13_63_9]|nr:MAG: hypothetical protein A2Y74_05675 [Actinobacteria bacterium RBG_13_63_9]